MKTLPLTARLLRIGILFVMAAGPLTSVSPTTRAQGKIEIVTEVKNEDVKLTRGQTKTVWMRVRNTGDADLAIKDLQFDYADDVKPAPKLQPKVVGLDGAILPKGVDTHIAVVFPAYPDTATYKGELFVTRQGPGNAPERFHEFKIVVAEPDNQDKALSEKVSGWLAALLAAVMLVLTVFVRVNGLNFFQSPDGSYSVSRFQVWFWTEVVLFSYAYLFFFAGSDVEFPSSIWALLGISIGSTGVATGLAVKNDAAKAAAAAAAAPGPAPPPPPAPAGKVGAIRSMLSDDGKPSMMRLQMFAWTIATGVLFLRQVYATETLWDVPSNLLILMGISHGGYLVDKGVKNP
jgi:hypothetical protein